MGLEIAQHKLMAATMLLQGVPAASTQPARRSAVSGSVLALHRAARPAGQATQQRQAARQPRSLRVQAAQAAPPQTTGTGGGAEAGGDSGVFDVVVVGAGISGLTTAQVLAAAGAAGGAAAVGWVCGGWVCGGCCIARKQDRPGAQCSDCEM